MFCILELSGCIKLFSNMFLIFSRATVDAIRDRHSITVGLLSVGLLTVGLMSFGT